MEKLRDASRELENGNCRLLYCCCLPVGGFGVTGLLVGCPLQYILFACSMSLALSPRVFPSFVLPSLRVMVVRPFPKAVE